MPKDNPDKISPAEFPPVGGPCEAYRPAQEQRPVTAHEILQKQRRGMTRIDPPYKGRPPAPQSPPMKVPECPDCGLGLTDRPNSDSWECYGCGRRYTSEEIISGGKRLYIDPEFQLETKVHIFDQGSPLCGFTTLRPVDWPKGHERIPLDVQNQKETCNCIDCIRKWRPELAK